MNSKVSSRTYLQTTPLVSTQCGEVRGIEWNGVRSYKGIPYAQARRFHAPQPPVPWDKPLEAYQYGFIPPLSSNPLLRGDHLIPHAFWPQDEQCLNLNIWAPAHASSMLRPVIFAVFGGGFATGSAVEQVAFDGESITLHGDVVFVSINHRLNLLGFWDLSAFGTEYENTCNLGMQDILAALEWVRDNIAAFGGDPNNITILGQAGGGKRIAAMLQIPAMSGLFHKAVTMGGIADFGSHPTHDEMTELANRILSLAGETDIHSLETMPLEQLYALYRVCEKEMGAFKWAPVANGWYFGDVLTHGVCPASKHVPVIVGSSFSETEAFSAKPLSAYSNPEDLETAVNERFGEQGQSLLEDFRKAYPHQSPASILTFGSNFREPTLRYCDILAESGVNVYNYLFAPEFPSCGGLTAYHCSEVPFILHNTHKIPISQITGISDHIETQFCGAACAFAASGTPNGPNLPEWEPYTTVRRSTMIYSAHSECMVENDRQFTITHNRLFNRPGRKPCQPEGLLR